MSLKPCVQLTLETYTSISDYFTAMLSSFCSVLLLCCWNLHQSPSGIQIFLWSSSKSLSHTLHLTGTEAVRGTQTSTFLMKSEQTSPLVLLHNGPMEIVPPLLLTQGVKASPSEACSYRHGWDISCFEENIDPNTFVKEPDICESYSFALKWKEPLLIAFGWWTMLLLQGQLGGFKTFSSEKTEEPPTILCWMKDQWKQGISAGCWIWDPANQAGILLPKSMKNPKFHKWPYCRTNRAV